MKKIEKTKVFFHKNKDCCICSLAVLILCFYYLSTRTYFCDELSTFELFIEKGALFSATNYPYPNNHVLYSVLSSWLFGICGSPEIGLRGICVIACIINIFLLCYILKLFVNKYIAILGGFLYVGNSLINVQLVQGRGYTLTFTFLLLGLLALYHICVDDKQPHLKWFLLYMLSLFGGLYTIPAFLYCVVALSLTGGFYLLSLKKFDILKRLISFSVAAAFLTVIAYLPILLWEGYLSVHQADVNVSFKQLVLEHPIELAFSGMGKITNNEWTSPTGVNQITSLSMIAERFLDIYSSFYKIGETSGIGKIFSSLCVLGAFITSLIGGTNKNLNIKFMAVFNLSAYISVFGVILVQQALPFHRVLAYLAIPTVIGFCMLVSFMYKKKMIFAKLLFLTALVGAIISILSIDYNNAYIDDYNTDKQITESLKSIDMSQVDSVLFGTEYQHQHMNFYAKKYHWNYIENDYETPDLIMLNTYQMEPGFQAKTWPDYINYDTIPWCFINENMEIIYRDKYTVTFYRRAKQ